MWGVIENFRPSTQTRLRMSLKRVAVAALSVVALANLIGCKADQNTFSTASASTGGGSGTVVDANAGFRLTVTAKTGISALLHKFGDYAATCEIAKTATSPQSINCLLNMMEYDLFFYGFELNLNVPSGFCEYLEEVPYYFWKAEPGVGPSTATITVSNGVMTACTVDGVAGTVSGGTTCTSGEAIFDNSGGATCQYDYSKVKSGDYAGPNCCFGTATITTVTTTGTSTTTTATQKDWGGTVKSCMESPHNYLDSSVWPQTTGGAATRVTELVGGSRSISTKFKGILSLYQDGKRPPSRSTFLLANMYDWPTYQANPATWSANADVPRAISLGVDRGAAGSATVHGGTAIGSLNDAYSFRCLGPAGELKHLISLYVQQWNTKEQYDTYAAAGAYATANPYVLGTAGTNCSAVPGSISCNNFWSFDDLINVYDPGNQLSYIFPNEWLRSNPN